MLTKHPDLDGIWAVWDVPAEGVMAAARAAGRNDLMIATEDLGKNVAIALAKNAARRRARRAACPSTRA